MKTSAEQAYKKLVDRLRELGRVEARLEVGWGLLLSLALLVGMAGLAALVEAVAYLPSGVRLSVLGALALSGIGLVLRFGVIPWVRRRSLEGLALKVEAKHPELKQRLIGALQLWPKHEATAETAEIAEKEKEPIRVPSAVNRGMKGEGYSSAMIGEVVRRASAMLAGINVREIVDRTRVRRFGWIAGIAVGFFVGSVLIFDGFGGALVRYAHPLTAFERPRRTRVTLKPGDVEVIRGEDVDLRVTLRGKVPDRITLYTKEADMSVWNETEIATGGKDTVSYAWNGLRISADYYVQAGDGASDLFRATVIERPMVQRLRLTYEFPPYTRLGVQIAPENEGDIRALMGTNVRFEATANKALQKAQWVMADGRVADAEVDGRTIRTELVIKKTGSYHIALTDRKGIPNADPIEYEIVAMPDAFPDVEILEPGADTDLAENMLMPLLIEARDDFGISKMEVVFSRVGSEQTFRTEVGGQRSEVRGRRSEVSGRSDAPPVTSHQSPLTAHQTDFVWDLSSLDLLPEDRVQYHVEVWDNDTVSGPKRAQSATFLLRLPSMHEIFRELVEEQEEHVTGMEQMLEEEKQLREKVEETRRELLREKELGWERRKDMEAVLDRQEQIADQVQQLAEKTDEMVAELAKRNLAAEEMLTKLAQIRQLMEEMATPEMRAAMEALNRAMEEMDPEALRKALEEFEFSQEAFEQQLDRTLSLLKRLQLEQQLDAAVKMAEDLAKRQERINEAIEAGEDPKKLAGQEKQVERDVAPLSETLAGLNAAMEETEPGLSAALDSLRRDIEEQGLGEHIARMAQLLDSFASAQDKENQNASAGRMGKKIAGDLNALRSGLKSLQESLQQSGRDRVTKEMREMLRGLLYLSEHQEALGGITESTQRNRSALPGLALAQQGLLEGASRLADRLYQTAGETFFVTPNMGQALGEALKAMERATSGLVEKNAFGARQHQGKAMTALNHTAMLIRNALAELASSGSGLGFEEMMRQLEGLSAQQQGINQQTMPFGQGKKPGLSGQALMEQLAARQLAARKGLEELLKSMGNQGRGLGRLDRTVEEMRQVAEDLKHGRVDQKTIQRQQRILSRLLDAQRSLKKREYSRRREAERAQAFGVRRPGALPGDLGERERALREDLSKALKEGYSEEYQQLIRRYFEAIGRKNEK
ncbi:MAG: hypothetical protein B1H02_03760 [Candidatus Latescibacteria bacterium 4484_107]|nr:MAG: hypothetical protein B1H02_03760 [Candidatus Latescibacteria bacterium 4484_107]